MLTKEQQESAKKILQTEVKAYFDVKDELGLTQEQYLELVRLDVHEWRIRARRKTPIKDELGGEIVSRYNKYLEQGVKHPYLETAKDFRRTQIEITNHLRKNRGMEVKVTMERNGLNTRTPELDKFVCDLYDIGLPVRLILIELRYHFKTTKSIEDILKEYGRSSKDLLKKELHLNSHIFNFIDTEEKAYWLGMLLTDGWVHVKKPKKDNHSKLYQVGLSLQMSDWEILEKFKVFTGSTREIQIKRNKLDSGEVREYGQLIIESEIMFNDLSRYGVIERKSDKTMPNLSLIPRELQRHFWRGCLDGDGSIYYGSNNNLTVRYTGNLDITYKFIAHLYHNNIINHFRPARLIDNNIDIKNGINATVDMYEFTYANKEDVYNILKHLYDGSKVYMERKQNFWKELKENA